MEEDDYISRETMRLREKQAKCNHPSYKCSLCGLYKDNIENEYKTIIKGLLEQLHRQETAYVCKEEITIVTHHEMIK